MKKEVNVIDLFCGAGGLSTGFKQAGFNVILGIDNDGSALKTFKLNHPESEILEKDISKNDPRNFLINQFLRIVSLVEPEIFVIENVHGLRSMKDENGRLVLDLIGKRIKKLRYSLKTYILNAEEYGVSQKRKRIFLVGGRKSVDLKIKKTNKTLLKNILLDKNDVPGKYFYSQKLIKGFKRREKINKKLGRGFGWRFLSPDDTSYTISARYYKDGAEALVKYSENQIRRLTPEECALIQSFPKDYRFEGGIIKMYKQIGNAVPPKLGFAVAKAIKNAVF
ncbi:DNA (cytosine-5-)-methyltransferase [Candidatus Pacearchaeota archaeon]|nr:DNA (cytosine-5-)-methyltransferase [Candidatus Pacearchaeota archaeon]